MSNMYVLSQFFGGFGDTVSLLLLVLLVLEKGGKIYATAYPEVPLVRLYGICGRLSASRGANHHQS